MPNDYGSAKRAEEEQKARDRVEQEIERQKHEQRERMWAEKERQETQKREE